MIFVTTGTQEPFDRLMMAIDVIAQKRPDIQIVAQVARSLYQARNLRVHEFLTPVEFSAHFSNAKLIVSHAGMGTIISALVQEKPILVFPRLAKYGEHRNDHQLATARAFEKLHYVHAAYSEEELEAKLLTLMSSNSNCLHKIGKTASQELISSLQNYIAS